MKSQTQLLNSNSITYRNAIYEGSIDPKTQTRKDFGIIYMAKTHQIIVCNNWHNDFLQGECLFYNDDKKYVYGTWINNLPQGFNVFRLEDTLVMAEFNRGRLPKNTRILIIFEKYNIAAILVVVNEPETLDDLQLQIFTKKEVFSSEYLKQLFIQCKWPVQYFANNQTLIKYISTKLTKQTLNNAQKHNLNPCKLRLIENKYYRFGYDDGLAIVFDEDFNRVSVGSHCRSKIKSFGVVFDRPEPVVKPQKGKIIKIQSQNALLKTALKNQMEKTHQKQPIQQNKKINTNLLIGVNFCNKFYKNPSKLFQFYIQNIINQASVRNLIAGSLTTRRLYEQSLQFSRIDSNRGNNLSSQEVFNEKKFQQQLQEQRGSSSRLSKNKIVEDRLRLQTIKKEIYDSLDKKKNKIERQIMKEQYQREIIHKDIVGGKSYYQTPEKTLDKSRSRKRIFQESEKNKELLRDFTPSRSEPNLTPFKTKMKNRIFNGQSSKISQKRQYNPSQTISRNRNNRNMYAEQVDQLEIQPAVLRDFNRFSSGHSSNNRESNGLSKSRDLKSRNTSQMKQQRQQSLKEYHVTFQDQRQLGKISNVSSKKYPSQNEKNRQYVPINPNQVKPRRKISHNFISIEDSQQDQQPQVVLKKPQQKYSLTKSRDNGLDMKKNKQEQQKLSLKQKQKITPQSKFYIQKTESQQFSNRMSRQRSSKNLEMERQVGKQMGKRQFVRQLNKESNFYEDSMEDFKQQKDVKRESISYKQQYKQIQNKTPKKVIYNQQTFKQNSPSEEYENKQQINQSKRSAFKNSNQVYLGLHEHKPSARKMNETQNKKSNQNVHHHLSQNKSISSRDDPKQRPRQAGSSYMEKHKAKKSIQKEIEKSPDRHRCYGKNANNPYLQNSPHYSKDVSYQNSNRKSQMQYVRTQMQFDDSSYKITRKQIINSNRNYPTRLF